MVGDQTPLKFRPLPLIRLGRDVVLESQCTKDALQLTDNWQPNFTRHSEKHDPRGKASSESDGYWICFQSPQNGHPHPSATYLCMYTMFMNMHSSTSVHKSNVYILTHRPAFYLAQNGSLPRFRHQTHVRIACLEIVQEQSTKHLLPLGGARKNKTCSMSSSDMPSKVDICACGKARKKRAVANRSSRRAR